MSHNRQSQGDVLTGARQTMAAWSRVIKTREDIPGPYQNLFDSTFDSRQAFPRVLLTPALNHFPRKTTERLVVDAQDALHIFERQGSRVEAFGYPYGEAYAVELGVVLLEAWLTVHGRTRQGGDRAATVQFNTLSLRHFEQILQKLRPTRGAADAARLAAEKDKFNSLSTVHFKLMNYGRKSLVPGETVLRFVLQPEIRQPMFTLFGRTFYRTASVAHLTVLTDAELILIRDPEGKRESSVDRYGAVWQFIPLRAIESVALSEAADERLLLSIRHRPGARIERLFEASRRGELEQLCAQLRTLVEQTRA